MAKVLLAKGARGELVRKVQSALASQGFDPQGADGKFGKDTEAASEVQALQLELADRDYGQPAAETANALGLKTELGRALAFDIHVQNGGIKRSARKEIDTALEETHFVLSNWGLDESPADS
jgi:peptidoglycan hydrolase-like protein with peptidoglycan-binding domain